MGRAGGERSWAARNGWATIRAAAAHSFFDSDVTRSNCGAAALPLPLRACGVPSGQSVRALPRANSGWGGPGAAARSALPRVRRVAGRVRVEKRVIGHIFALGCRVVVCFGTAEYEWTGLATRARPRRAVPLTGSGVGFRKSARRRWQRLVSKRSRDRGRGLAEGDRATPHTGFDHFLPCRRARRPAAPCPRSPRARRSRTLSCRRARRRRRGGRAPSRRRWSRYRSGCSRAAAPTRCAGLFARTSQKAAPTELRSRCAAAFARR